MDKNAFAGFRKRLNKTQREMAQLLGTSLKAIHSYEQGWRRVPAHVERQIYFLLALQEDRQHPRKACWTVRKCPTNRKKQCPAWEFRAGKLCWCINGTICEGRSHKTWEEKIEICKSCEVLAPLL